jgi:flagellar biosynthesis protein FlhB
MDHIFSEVTSNIIKKIYNETLKAKNKKRLEKIVSVVTLILLKKIQPYIFGILTMLVILFLMNILQFYYYLSFRQMNLDYSSLPSF